MMSKTLFIVLIGCAAVFASPVKRDVLDNELVSAETTNIGSALKEFIKRLFGQLLGKIGNAIKESLQQTFQQLGERLQTKEYNEAVQELSDTMQKIADNQEKLKNDKETKEYLEKEAHKVGVAFEKLVEEAVEKIKNNEEGTVNAEEFKKVVHEFKEIVDKVL